MNRLKEFIVNHEDQAFKELLHKPLRDLVGLTDYRTVKELIVDFDILINVFVLIKYNSFILRLVASDNEVKVYNWLSKYILFGVIIFMLVFPWVVSEYWLFILILLIPIALFSSGILRSPIKTLFFIIVTGIIIYSIAFRDYTIIAMTIPPIILIICVREAKILYRNTMINSAARDELNFKFLWFIGMIQLRNKLTNEVISHNQAK